MLAWYGAAVFWQRARAGMGAVAVAAALTTALTACGDDGESASPEPTIGGSSSPSPTEDPDEAAVVDVVEQYWDAYIQTQTEPTSDPAVYEGVAYGAFVEQSLQTAEQYEETNVRRVGEPKISDPIVKARGDDRYVVTQCVDERKWAAEVDGETVDPPPGDARRRRDLVVERRDDEWLVTDTAKKQGPDPCES